MDKIKPGKYLHYKGNPYEVLGTARHSETGEELVVYKVLYPTEGPTLWVRPLEMFCETVLLNDKRVPRFRPDPA
jgi:hypothetical protein